MLQFDRFNFVRLLPIISIACIICVLLIRILSPSDVHDQTQPKTVAYTTNIVLNAGDYENWILPLEVETLPATKPPLYNWLAVPFVALTDGRFEWAHKVPSIFAFLVLNLILFRLLRRIDAANPATAYFAVLIFSSHYMWFKLSYLARPDSLLTLFLITGWIASTMLVQQRHATRERSRRWAFVLWGSTALALIAKGPAAVLIPLFLYGLLWSWDRPDTKTTADIPVRWRDRFRLRHLGSCGTTSLTLSRAWVGLPLALIPFGVWLWFVFLINPQHLYDVLIRAEILDRMLGVGSEGTGNGPWDILRTLPSMPLMFLSRFLPWSVFFIAALFDLKRRLQNEQRNRTDQIDERDESKRLSPTVRIWLTSCLVGVVLPILVFSFSAGKRADYVASACFPASVFVAWSLTHLGKRWAISRPAWLTALAAATIVSFTVFAFRFELAARYPLSDSLIEFAREVRPIIDADSAPRPVEFYRTGYNPLQTLLHRSQSSDPSMAAAAADTGEPFWLFVRSRDLEVLRAEPWMSLEILEEVARSKPVQSDPTAKSVEVILYFVKPEPIMP